MNTREIIERLAWIQGYQNELVKSINQQSTRITELLKDIAATNKLEVGSIVIFQDGTGLRYISSTYRNVIVASVNPLFLISDDGEAVWHFRSEVASGLLVIGKVNRTIVNKLKKQKGIK